MKQLPVLVAAVLVGLGLSAPGGAAASTVFLVCGRPGYSRTLGEIMIDYDHSTVTQLPNTDGCCTYPAMVTTDTISFSAIAKGWHGNYVTYSLDRNTDVASFWQYDTNKKRYWPDTYTLNCTVEHKRTLLIPE